jgi:hypothetical protein
MGKKEKGKEKEEKMRIWIQPFALSLCVKKFENLCQIIFREAKEKQKKSPIMICGPTGVGKSMFVEEFQKIVLADYEKQKEQSSKGKPEIVPLNCASFNNNLLTSEIFGHVKGAFTGANKSKEGLVEKANGGILILEEIGELPKDGQAKLLTFLEDGYYYRVGGTKREQSDVQIVATTNKEKDDFREDFWYRFFPFFVPPLHQRREDVLHYLGNSSPDILKQLKPWEALSLLAYHWPGNVREIERVSRMIEWEKENIRRIPVQMSILLSRDSLDHLTGTTETYTALSAKKSKNLKSRLTKSGIDTELLESLLNKYGLGLSPKDGKKNKSVWEYIIRDDDEYYGNKIETRMMPGLEFFCSLFLIDIKEDMNLFDIVEGDIKMPLKSPLSFIEDPKPKHLKLVKGIIEYRIGGKMPKEVKEIIDPSGEQCDRFKEMIIERAEAIKKAKNNDDKKIDLAAMKEEEVLAHYWQSLYRETGGDAAQMSIISGKKKRTIYERIDKFIPKNNATIRTTERKLSLNLE